MKNFAKLVLLSFVTNYFCAYSISNTFLASVELYKKDPSVLLLNTILAEARKCGAKIETPDQYHTRLFRLTAAEYYRLKFRKDPSIEQVNVWQTSISILFEEAKSPIIIARK